MGTNPTRLSRWFSTFVAAWLGMRLLQSKESKAFVETIPVKSNVPPGVGTETVVFAGRTLDLSLFAVTRAVDVIVGELWSRRRARQTALQQWTKVSDPPPCWASRIPDACGDANWLCQAESLVSRLTDSSVFAMSCALIMWSWIYHPARLPRSYNKWIASAAAVDPRLIEALQRCRKREIVYGEDTGQAPLLQAMCADYKWPIEWGDPAKAIPFPCEMVHMGCGPSCEYHALHRFYRSFLWSMATYLPLNLVLLLRKPTSKGLLRALVSAARSSTFLSAFISLFFYGVCLARTRLGPRILGEHRVDRQRIDGGICVGSGCALCGWSVLFENAGRRKDMALFVAPRALATLLPRRYSLDKQWRETLVFATSTAVVFTCAKENKSRVRGVLGNVLGTVLEG